MTKNKSAYKMMGLFAGICVSSTTLHSVEVKFMFASECNINNDINMFGTALPLSLKYNIVK